MTDLKTLALAANSAHPCTSWYDSESLIYMGYDDDCDASYIAAASPDAILKLLAERDKMVRALGQISASATDNWARNTARAALEIKQ